MIYSFAYLPTVVNTDIAFTTRTIDRSRLSPVGVAANILYDIFHIA